MNGQNAGVLESSVWGVSLSREEMDRTHGGWGIIGWVVATFIASAVVGMIDKAISGDCTCR